MTSVPTIYPGIHSNAHSSCMANELHGAEKKRKDTETQKKMKRTLPTDKKPKADAHSKPQPAVALRFLSLCPFPLCKFLYHIPLLPHTGLWLPKSSAKKSQTCRQFSFLPPHTFIIVPFCSCCFPSYAVTQNGKSD